MSIKGKVSLVTGAGSGIGKAVALSLLREGVNVFLARRRLEMLEETKNIAEKMTDFGMGAVELKIDGNKNLDDNINLLLQFFKKELITQKQ